MSEPPKPNLHVIDGTLAPNTAVEKVRKQMRAMRPSWRVSCPRCASIEVMPTYLGMMTKSGGRPYGGNKVWICAPCHMRGERVVVG